MPLKDEAEKFNPQLLAPNPGVRLVHVPGFTFKGYFVLFERTSLWKLG